MKQNRGVSGGEFLRVRVKKNKTDWTTISLEKELIDLMKVVFGLATENDVKEFVNRITEKTNLQYTTYSQAVKREILREIEKKYRWLYNQVQPKLID